MCKNTIKKNRKGEYLRFIELKNMRAGYILTEKEASELIIFLNYAKVKLPDGKQKTVAQNLYNKYVKEVTGRYIIK